MLAYMWLLWLVFQMTDGACIKSLKLARSLLLSPELSRMRTSPHKWRLSRTDTRQMKASAKMTQITLTLLLLIAGNIEPNPGPAKFPCGTCNKPCRSFRVVFNAMNATYGRTGSV